jgi:predicted S18 family serine protease
MKTLIALLLVITLLTVAGAALAQTGGEGSAPAWRVQPGASSGGSYQLASLTWQVNGTATGEGYALISPPAPALRGSGCCCTYLPCILRSW